MSQDKGSVDGELVSELREALAEFSQDAASSSESLKQSLLASLTSIIGGPDKLPLSDLLQLRRTLGDESDRGCVLMAASYLESALGDLLRAFLVADSKPVEALLTGSGGLATFSSRIDLTYLLGLIGPSIRRDLHLIRRIRNEFAHDPTPLKFGDERIASRCGALYHDVFQDDLPPRKKFIRVTMGVAGGILGATLSVKRQELRTDADFKDPKLIALAREARDTIIGRMESE